MGRNIKVLNVDDSVFIRKLLRDILSTDKDFVKIDQAKNGKEALELIQKNDYDVITLDIEMPILDGISTLKEIMRLKATPVVMLSSSTKEGAKITLDALEIGAVDFITKPQNIFLINEKELKSDIIDTVKSAIKVNLNIMKTPHVYSFPKKPQIKPISNSFNSQSIKTIIAIGTSTGGPRALHEVIPNISANINAPILIVQHMPKGFTKSLADRLNSVSNINVKEAEDGDILKNGFAYVAPGGQHMKIKQIGLDKFKIYLEDSENISGHKPSVDAMMFSILENQVKEVIAVIMTGMGNDGAKGMERLKVEKKAKTIAEDEKTCVVFGMPKSAIETGKVDSIVPLNKIADELNKIMGV